jgi:hypothetical protein
MVHLLPLTMKECMTSILNSHIAGWVSVQVENSGGRLTFSTVAPVGTSTFLVNFEVLITVTKGYALL